MAESYFRQDIDRFFGSEVSIDEFGGKPKGLMLWRHVVVQLVLNPGLLAVGLYRASRHCKLRGWEIPSRVIDRINEAVCGIQITGEADFGPGLEIHHPQGIVISPLTKTGKNCKILGAAVTTGLRDLDHDIWSQTVTLGDNVMIATGAKLLGPLMIGDNVNIGPNVVLLDDVPSDTTVVVGGKPFMIEHKKNRNAEAA